MNKNPAGREDSLARTAPLHPPLLLERALLALRTRTGLEGKAVAVECDLAESLRPEDTVEIDAGGKPYRYTVGTNALIALRR